MTDQQQTQPQPTMTIEKAMELLLEDVDGLLALTPTELYPFLQISIEELATYLRNQPEGVIESMAYPPEQWEEILKEEGNPWVLMHWLADTVESADVERQFQERDPEEEWTSAGLKGELRAQLPKM